MSATVIGLNSSCAANGRAKPAPVFKRPNALDAKLVISGIDELAQAISKSWFDLSPEAQVRALELESRLSFLRRQLA